jgi:hypothetical protein
MIWLTDIDGYQKALRLAKGSGVIFMMDNDGIGYLAISQRRE